MQWNFGRKTELLLPVLWTSRAFQLRNNVYALCKNKWFLLKKKFLSQVSANTALNLFLGWTLSPKPALCVGLRAENIRHKCVMVADWYSQPHKKFFARNAKFYMSLKNCRLCGQVFFRRYTNRGEEGLCYSCIGIANYCFICGKVIPLNRQRKELYCEECSSLNKEMQWLTFLCVLCVPKLVRYLVWFV